MSLGFREPLYLLPFDRTFVKELMRYREWSAIFLREQEA